jgi:TatD DNase family protein
MAASLTDSHCHLNFEHLLNNLPQVLQNARENGVGYMLCVGVTIEKLPEVLALAHEYPNIFASVGVHPDEQRGRDPSVDELVHLANDPRVVAIGETGLDYYRIKGDMTWQQDRFRRHIRAACVSHKPLIIHTREAAADTIRVLQEEGAESVGGVMHCFTESWETARVALDLGFYISFSGIITFRNADSLRAVAAKVPADRLLIETDAPYLAPVPYRGKTNEPAFVRYVAEELAKLRGVSLDELARTTTQNFFTLFKHAHSVDSVQV